ncbi:MAG: PEP-CTERM sorting domain-containing protein [Cuspidothrix sp.]
MTDACLLTLCSNPDEYLFFDPIHPTSYAHSLIAKEIQKSIPEPSTYFGLLGIAGLGASGVIKCKRKTINSANLVLAAQSSHTKVES